MAKPQQLRAAEFRFDSTLFNDSEVRDYFINDSCFGDDLGKWLRPQLEARGHTVVGPDQEDWGWYLDVNRASFKQCLRIGYGGEWLMFLDSRRLFRKRIDPQLYADIREILTTTPEISGVHFSAEEV